MASKTIGVTGASGYIGGAICMELMKRGYTVLGIDTVKPTYLYDYIDEFDHDSFTGIEVSYNWRKCDAIVHCAATSLVGESDSAPSLYYTNNVAKTISLLNWCVSYDVPIIFSSSASVYRSKPWTLIETDEIDPRSVYAKSKYMIEQIINDYTSAYGLKATIFRYFNVCGSISDLHGQKPGATHIFARLFEDKENFVLNGDDFNTKDGTCVRDYVHIQDIVDAHIAAIEQNVYGTYNLGSGVGFSNKEIIDAFGLNTWRTGSRRIGDVPSLVASNTLAKRTLNWEPKRGLEDIINDLTMWYNSESYKGLQKCNR